MQKAIRGLCFIALLVLGGAPGGVSTAKAEEYVAPTYSNLVKMLVRFNALDIADNEVLDSYAMVQECKLFRHFHADDFKWHELQIAMRKSIRQDVETFPTGIYYKTKLQLGRYDFKDKFYKFTAKTSPKNVNLFMLYADNESTCAIDGNNVLPRVFQLVLDQPVSLPGLPLGEEEGKILLSRLDKDGNRDHIIYTRLSMRVVYIAPLRRRLIKNGKAVGGLVQKKHSNGARIDSRLMAIDFFEDPEMTKIIYSYRP